MKKLLLIVFAAAMMSSCGDEYYYDGAQMETYFITAGTSDNKWDEKDELGSGVYWACSFRFPEITQDVFDYGKVFVDVFWDHDGGTYEPLPGVKINEDDLNGPNEHIWINNLTYQYQRGWVTIFYTNSDFVYPPNEPPLLKFKVTIMY